MFNYDTEEDKIKLYLSVAAQDLGRTLALEAGIAHAEPPALDRPVFSVPPTPRLTR